MKLMGGLYPANMHIFGPWQKHLYSLKAPFSSEIDILLSKKGLIKW